MNELSFPLNISASMPYMPSYDTDCASEIGQNHTAAELPTPDLSGFSQIIEFLLQAISQTRIIHWNAYSFSSHVAMHELYNALSDAIDDFAEYFLGLSASDGSSKPSLEIRSDTSFQFPANPISFVHFLKDTLVSQSQVFQTERSISNKYDELLGAINRTIYKLERLA